RYSEVRFGELKVFLLYVLDRFGPEDVQISDGRRGYNVELDFIPRELPRFLDPLLDGEVRPRLFGVYELTHIAADAQVSLRLCSEARLGPVLVHIRVIDEYVGLGKKLRQRQPDVL